MIIWRGWGILVMPIALLFAGGGITLAQEIFSSEFEMLGMAAGSAIAAVIIYPLGARLNAPKVGYHPQTGQPVEFRNQHTLFFIPMQHWGFIALAASALSTVAAVAIVLGS